MVFDLSKIFTRLLSTKGKEYKYNTLDFEAASVRFKSRYVRIKCKSVRM